MLCGVLFGSVLSSGNLIISPNGLICLICPISPISLISYKTTIPLQIIGAGLFMILCGLLSDGKQKR